jgi:hypothetical protein
MALRGLICLDHSLKPLGAMRLVRFEIVRAISCLRPLRCPILFLA